MEILSKILVAIVALEHFYILYLEMFLWTKPKGLKTFGMKREEAEQSKTLAANQGLYNGFLAAGLIWGLVHPNQQFGIHIQLFFLLCILTAALYGGLSAKRSILFIQGLPALLALIVLLLEY